MVVQYSLNHRVGALVPVDHFGNHGSFPFVHEVVETSAVLFPLRYSLSTEAAASLALHYLRMALVLRSRAFITLLFPIPACRKYLISDTAHMLLALALAPALRLLLHTCLSLSTYLAVSSSLVLRLTVRMSFWSPISI